MDNSEERLKLIYAFVKKHFYEAKYKGCEAIYLKKDDEVIAYTHEVIAYSTVLDKLEMYLST